MKKNEPTLSSIVKSCTLSILFITSCIYLIYLFNDLILDIYYKIENLILIVINSIFSFINSFSFIISNNISIIFPIWLFIFSLSCCILFKLDKNNIEIPKILKIIISFILPVGVIVLLYTSRALINEYLILSIICHIMSYLVFIFSLILIMNHFISGNNTQEEQDEKQLDLFK